MKIKLKIGNMTSPLLTLCCGQVPSPPPPTEICMCRFCRCTAVARTPAWQWQLQQMCSICGDGAHAVECLEYSAVRYVETGLVMRSETDSAFVMLRLTHLLWMRHVTGLAFECAMSRSNIICHWLGDWMRHVTDSVFMKKVPQCARGSLQDLEKDFFRIDSRT